MNRQNPSHEAASERERDASPFSPPRKRFGQNFLRDRQAVARILRAVAPQPGERVVEIGPGRGALTEPLIEAVAAQGGRLTVIELDRDLAAYWRERAECGAALEVIAADALEVDLAALGSPLVIVGNLPYNVSSPLLFHFAQYHENIARLVLMLQKEVVDRMAAQPGSKAYGRLSVMVQRRFRVTKCFDVPPGAFWPVPKVVSSVVTLIPLRPDPYPMLDESLFAEVVKRAFGQRRKTVANALKGLVESEMLRAAGVDPTARAETLSVETFVRLTERCARGGS